MMLRNDNDNDDIDDIDDGRQYISYQYYFNDQLTRLSVMQDTTKADLGLTVWDSSIIMAKYFERNMSRFLSTVLDSAYSDTATSEASRSLNIVELGAGTGLLGVVLKHLLRHYRLQGNLKPELPPIRMMLTDLARVKPLLVRNAAAVVEQDDEDGGMMSLYEDSGVDDLVMVKELDWYNTAHSEQARTHLDGQVDVILVSDCIYQASLFDALVSTLVALSGTTTVVYLGYEKRNFDSEVEFFRKLGKHFTFSHVKSEDLDPRWSSPDEIYIFIARRKDSFH